MKRIIISTIIAASLCAGSAAFAQDYKCGKNTHHNLANNTCACNSGYTLDANGYDCVREQYEKKTRIGGYSAAAAPGVVRTSSDGGYTNIQVVYLNYLTPSEAKTTIDGLGLSGLAVSVPAEVTDDKTGIGSKTRRNYIILQGGQGLIDRIADVIAEIDKPLRTISFQVVVVDVKEEYSKKLSMTLLPSFVTENHAKIVSSQEVSVLDGKTGLVGLFGNRNNKFDDQISQVSIDVAASITDAGKGDMVLKIKPVFTKVAYIKGRHTIVDEVFNTVGIFDMLGLSPKDKRVEEVNTVETTVNARSGEEVVLGLTKYDGAVYKNYHGLTRLAKTKKKVMENRVVALILVPTIRKDNQDNGTIDEMDYLEKINNYRY